MLVFFCIITSKLERIPSIFLETEKEERGSLGLLKNNLMSWRAKFVKYYVVSWLSGENYIDFSTASLSISK